jgi:4-hydroxybenzoate polyprenyltransferase
MTMITQAALIYFMLEPSGTALALDNWQVILLMLATGLITAGGNVINDIYDVSIDMVNKPDNVIVGKRITEKKAFSIYIWVTAVAVVLGFVLANSVEKPLLSILFIAVAYLLYLYASQLKSIMLVGNVLISLLVGLVVLVTGIFELYPTITTENRSIQGFFFKLLLDYALFASMINLLREWVKDCQDVDGDHAGGKNTLPIVLGRSRAAKVMGILGIIPLGLIGWYVYENLYQNPTAYYYFLFAVLMPLLYVIIRLFSASSKSDFRQLSMVLKGVLVTGIGSIMVIYLSNAS